MAKEPRAKETSTFKVKQFSLFSVGPLPLRRPHQRGPSPGGSHPVGHRLLVPDLLVAPLHHRPGQDRGRPDASLPHSLGARKNFRKDSSAAASAAATPDLAAKFLGCELEEEEAPAFAR